MLRTFCEVAYLGKSICYLLKSMEYLCEMIDFMSDKALQNIEKSIVFKLTKFILELEIY